MIIKKIGTSSLPDGNDDPNQKRDKEKRQDDTTSLEALRNSLGAGSTLGRGLLLENRYEVEQVIGYGGMSTVYRARDIRFTQTVRVCAIKEMFDVSTDPNVRQDKMKRFEEEANFLALLNHQSIPKIFDFFAANDRRYLVMELIEGKNLETIIEENGTTPLDEAVVLDWGIKLCEVLYYLHNHKPKPIVFRDMKPSNVMFTKDNRLVLIDFGIAKTFQEDRKGTMIGTEGYSPPEQYKGMALPGGDIYALGATLHQLLTASDPRVEIPFTFHERMPRSLNPLVTPETEVAVMKALEFDINNRYANVEDMRDTLQRILMKTGPAPKRAPSGSSLLKKGVGTRDLSAGAENDYEQDFRGSTAEITRAAGMTGTNPTMPTHAIQPMRPPTAGSIKSKIPQSTDQTEINGLPDDTPMTDLIWSFACEEELRSTAVVNNGTVYIGSYDSNLYALDAKNGGFLWKAATTSGVCTTPCIAERLVVVGSEDGTLYAFDQAKGQQIWQTRTGAPIRSSARFQSPLIFFGSDDTHIYCIEARTGKQVWKQRTWAQVRSTPLIHAGTIYIGSMDSHLYALDGNTGNVKWKYRAGDGIYSSPVISGNFLLVGSMDNMLHCIDTSSSWKVWTAKTGGYVNSSPLVHNNKAYVGSVDGYLYCIDMKNGRTLWKFNTGKQITSSPRIEGGIVYFGGVDGIIYALDADKGKPRWFYPTEGPVTASPVIDEGILYIGSIDYRLYALAANLGD